MTTYPLQDYVITLLDKFDPCKRPRKLSNQDCFQCLLACLTKNLGWRDLPTFMRLHCSWSTIYKRFAHWVEKGVIERVWRELLKVYAVEKVSHNPEWFKTVFIDSTHIRNVQGRDGLGRNHSDRGRLNTKLSCVCDNDGVVLSSQLYPSNYNDCLTTVAAVENMACDIRADRRRSVFVVGDKGYISTRAQQVLKPKGFNLITPFRRNQRHRQLTNKDRCYENVLSLSMCLSDWTKTSDCLIDTTTAPNSSTPFTCWRTSSTWRVGSRNYRFSNTDNTPELL